MRPWSHDPLGGSPVQAFLVSLSTVAIAELGDRTQLLSLMLAVRFRRPWPILAGVLIATLANHALAAFIGVRVAHLLSPAVVDVAVGASMIAMALWTLKPDTLDERRARPWGRSALLTTVVTFFIAEIGDKTQIATAALAAAYLKLAPVVAGTTTGMLLANAPVVFLGKAFAARLPLKAIRYAASIVFLALGAILLLRALHQGVGA
jgi:putative Ca2+/H+ antiporter (TMEM165/GDT1 family)